MAGLAGPQPFEIAVAQAKYWVYLNASWDWKTLSYGEWVGLGVCAGVLAVVVTLSLHAWSW